VNTLQQSIGSFAEVLARIAGGESVSSTELLPYIFLERPDERERCYRLLAQAYFESGRPENLSPARSFVQRAWLVGGCRTDLLPLYIKIHSALDDIPAIRDAFKRLGIAAAARGDVATAISYFDRWQYAYMEFKRLDKFEYDFDVLDAMHRLAKPHRLRPKTRSNLLNSGKIRVAYLVKGITETGSVLIKVTLLFARYHDRSRFEPMFFVPESERDVLASEAGPEHLRRFEEHGYKVMMARSGGGFAEQLRDVARAIYDKRADVLVTCGALAQFQHYYITSLRPAPIVLGMVQGPPPQFAPPDLDGGLAWSKHPLLDTPLSCVWTPLANDLPDPDNITPYERRELDIPDDARVVASAGRYVKFQEPRFWQAIVELLSAFPQVYYLVMGPEESQIPFLSEVLTPESRARIRFMGWRGDSYLKALSLAEILIDTFPSGGGGALLDALALGIPSVAFENDYTKLYDQTDWSLADELIDIPELLIPRWDFERLKRSVARLLEDDTYRRDIAQRQQAYVLETRGNPKVSVGKCEDAYLQLIEQKLSVSAPDSANQKLEGVNWVPPRWFSRAALQLKRALRFGVRVLNRVT
jgi:hypothetical protein